MSSEASQFDVFFSYHTRDHATVEKVARSVAARGLRVFLDRWYLIPGQPWPAALERTLASCRAVAVFLGAEGLGSWQQREIDLALDRQAREVGFPVIPVLLTWTNPPLGFLKLNTWVDLSENPAGSAGLDALVAAVRGQPSGPQAQQYSAAAKAEVCPYRGLQMFREEDAAFFCGREAFTDKLVATVERMSVVAVVGASGSGKSSVVRAGLIPRLRQAATKGVWEFATLVPTDRPLQSLAAALMPILEPDLRRIDRLAAINQLAGHFAEGAVSLRDVVTDLLRTQPGTDRLLLVVDQWEELYTLAADDNARRRFIAEILDASAKGPVTVVLTLRGDFFGQALSDRDLADRLEGSQVNLGPMTRDELTRSMLEPAEKVDLRFEPGLVERILDEVGQEPGNLPLLEFVLAELWERRQIDTMQHAAYQGMGGIEGAIAARADAEFAKLSAEEREAAKRYLVRLVRPGETTEDTRQRAPLPAGDMTALAAIRHLADARLLVTARDTATGAEIVEVTHEALIHRWSLLRGWIDSDREFLSVKARLEAEAALWETDQRHPSRLLPPGRPLAEGQNLLASRRADLCASLVAFIEASAGAVTRRRRRWASLGAAALAMAIGGVGVYWDFNIRPHETFFNAYTKRGGVLEGVGPVSADAVKARSRTFRFVHQGRGGPVIQVEAIDGTGGCARTGLMGLPFITASADPFDQADNPTRPCKFVYDRDSQGRLSKQTVLDARKREILILDYIPSAGNTPIAEFRDPSGNQFHIGNAAKITFERIADGPNIGQDRLERASDASSRPATGPFAGGAYATRIEYDGLQGLMSRVVLLDENDKPMMTSAGFAEIRIKYESSGSPEEVSFLDQAGRPVRIRDGSARRTMAYDPRGNETEVAFFDEDGKPTLAAESHAQRRLEYDERGREKGRALFDEAGYPTLGKDGYARIVRTLDAEGRAIAEAYFGPDGKPILDKSGCARFTREYDPQGNPIRVACFDIGGKLTRQKENGVAISQRRFDGRGRLEELRFFDPAGNPTRSQEGDARRTLKYDPRRDTSPIEVAYFDEADRPTLSKDRYAVVKRKYDQADRITEEAYFDEAGGATLSKDGYAKLTKTYDERGELAGQARFDEQGKPIRGADWTARVESVRAVGKEAGEALRVMGQAVDRPAEKSKETMTQVDSISARLKKGIGVEITRRWFDESGFPVLGKGGFGQAVAIEDALGNEVSKAFFDERGIGTLSKEGVGRMLTEYDTKGRMTGQSYFDARGEPTAGSTGYFRIETEYDKRGNAIGNRFFDVNGQPTRSDDGYARIAVRYDARGNAVRHEYFDEAGSPVRSKHGYASVEYEYDARDNQTSEAYFNEQGKPTRHKDGYARVSRIYDDRDKIIEVAYREEAGNPVRGKDGYARASKAYDARGREIEERYFDETGQPIRCKKGYATIKRTYDERGNQTSEQYFDVEGRPTQDDDGVMAWRGRFDSRGNVIVADIVDAQGRLTSSKLGYSRVKKTYDSRNLLIALAFFDADERPTRSAEGYHKAEYRYDRRGDEVKVEYFDEAGHPLKSRDGYAGIEKVYDARGRLLDETYLDVHGKPTRSRKGYARLKNSYDRGEIKESAYFDEKGRPVQVRKEEQSPVH